MEGLDIRKLYGNHDDEMWTIERIYRGKTKTEDFRYKTYTQLSVHTYTSNGGEKKFLWREYGLTWVVKEMKPCEYTLREWTIQLLESCGCKLDCYKDSNCLSNNGYNDAWEDLEKYKEDNKLTFPFPVYIIAAELQRIGNEQPDAPCKGHKKYCMVFDMGHTIDGVEFDSFEEAKADMEDTYINWMVEECHNWKMVDGVPHPTEKQIEDYDYMIWNCGCWIVEWNDELGEYGDVDYGYALSQEELEALGWMEWNKFAKLNGWQ
jgi:hypothetical protein